MEVQRRVVLKILLVKVALGGSKLFCEKMMPCRSGFKVVRFGLLIPFKALDESHLAF